MKGRRSVETKPIANNLYSSPSETSANAHVLTVGFGAVEDAGGREKHKTNGQNGKMATNNGQR